MLHHNFRDKSLFENYNVSFFPFSEHQVVNMALACKVCVSIFAFITGYGLFISYRNAETTVSKWCLKRYIRTFSGYWFIWGASAVICQLINHRTVKVLWTGKLFESIVYVIIDFLGLAKLFGSPTLNGTWWYMSAAAIFIILIPFFYKCKDHLWIILFLQIAFIRIIHNNGSVYPGNTAVYAFLSPLTLGAIFANNNYFDKWFSIANNRPFKKICKFTAELAVLVLLYKIYHSIELSTFWEFHYGLFPTAMILFYVEFILPFKPVRDILGFFGKHSMNVFLTHTFIRYYYLQDFTYSWKHFFVICMVLLILSVAISIVAEKIKKILRYDNLINQLLKLCN